MQYVSARWFAPVRLECNRVKQASSNHGGATCTFEKGVDYASTDMHSVKASSQEDCCTKCVADGSCAAGVFVAKDEVTQLHFFLLPAVTVIASKKQPLFAELLDQDCR